MADPPAAKSKATGGADVEDKSANIQAIIQIRPPKKDEQPYLVCDPKVGDQLKVEDLDYTGAFTSVLGPESSQADVFRKAGMPLVEAALQGKRTCFFAYGQTGSGKTFSMYGADGGKNPSKLDGAVPAICAELFRRKQDLEKRKDFRLDIFATLVEVQGSRIIDLLADSLPSGEQPAVKLLGNDVQGSWKEQIHSSRGLTQVNRALADQADRLEHSPTADRADAAPGSGVARDSREADRRLRGPGRRSGASPLVSRDAPRYAGAHRATRAPTCSPPPNGAPTPMPAGDRAWYAEANDAHELLEAERALVALARVPHARARPAQPARLPGHLDRHNAHVPCRPRRIREI